MKDFELYQPETLEKAFSLLKGKDEYQLLAGGTDLLVKWKRGHMRPKNVINLKKVKELDFIKVTDNEMEIGALVKINDLIEMEEVQERYPALSASCKQHSSSLIRNLATVVGNICNASPAADLIPPLLVYDAKLKVKNEETERLVELKDFFTGHPGGTKLSQGEIVTSVIIPTPVEGQRSYFLKEGKRKAHEIAIMNCAVSYIDEGEQVSNLKVALGAVAPEPVFLDIDWFDSIGETSFERLSQEIEDNTSPITDQRSTEWYRRNVIQTLVKRAIVSADSV
ncbi:MAG: aldehyde oxidase and xanthine dehydrogenase, middle chain [Candidatus Frackibacter sp. T328-2]|nr:MAG: aldehyde oxidase and xanthine dehydrogenase, middle chain [Candidatus Frackibacter sp. T328-2]